MEKRIIERSNLFHFIDAHLTKRKLRTKRTIYIYIYIYIYKEVEKGD